MAPALQIRLQPRDSDRRPDRRRRFRLWCQADHSDPWRRGSRRGHQGHDPALWRGLPDHSPERLYRTGGKIRLRDGRRRRRLHRECRHPLRSEGAAGPHRQGRDCRSRIDLFSLGAEIRNRSRKIPLADGEPVRRRRRKIPRPRRDRRASGVVSHDVVPAKAGPILRGFNFGRSG
jgi:hypothetical protein